MKRILPAAALILLTSATAAYAAAPDAVQALLAACGLPCC